MGNLIEDLKDALKNFEGSVKKDMSEIMKQKAELQRLSEEIHDGIVYGRYVRDNTRLILSAPEIVIGNVDHDGNLLGGGSGSTVVIRGNAVALEGAGAVGAITERAPSIRQIAVDPGSDGVQNVVQGQSEIVSQARSITLMSNDDNDCFVTPAASVSVGVNILSDTSVKVHANPSAKNLKTVVEDNITQLGKTNDSLAKDAATAKANFEKVLNALETLVDRQSKYEDDTVDIRNDYDKIGDVQGMFEDYENLLCRNVTAYIRVLSQQAEVNRRIAALKAKKDELSKKESDFADIKNKAVNSSVSIESESVFVKSTDGDGNLRENPSAGLFVQMPHVGINAHDKDGKLIEDSSIIINTQDYKLSTSNPNLKYDDKCKPSGDITHGEKGSISIISKDIAIEAIDRKYVGEDLKESALIKDSKFVVRAENITASATDTEGKSTGVLALNAKKMNIAAMDVDKETRKDKEMAAGSQLTILAEKNHMGTSEKTQLIQLAGQKVGIIAKDTAEMQQDGKAVVTVSGGNLTAGGSKVELDGDTSIKGKADISGDTTAPKGSFKNLEASSSFKSSNISDGIAVPAPSSPGSPSAKMKEEEAKTTE